MNRRLVARNPFIDQLLVPVKKKYTNISGGVFMNDDAEGMEVAQITKVEAVDSERFIKLYTDELKQFFDLKPTTQKLLQVLLYSLQERKDKDLVYLDYVIAEEYFSGDSMTKIMSKASYYRALKELMEKEFIAESPFKNQYYINPKLFFNGNRLKLVKEYVRDDKKRLGETETKIELLPKQDEQQSDLFNEEITNG